MNGITNNPVTVKDIDIAKHIFGLNIGSLKSKIMKKKPSIVVKDYIKISEELIMKQQDIVLCIGSIKVNDLIVSNFNFQKSVLQDCSIC
jgi:hypothetical protein